MLMLFGSALSYGSFALAVVVAQVSIHTFLFIFSVLLYVWALGLGLEFRFKVWNFRFIAESVEYSTDFPPASYLVAETSSVSSVFIAQNYLRSNAQNRHPFHHLPFRSGRFRVAFLGQWHQAGPTLSRSIVFPVALLHTVRLVRRVQ